ncbi:5-oxoprolinase subunit PxpB [Thalassotalea marina]|uniref:Allophanate hydrolase n=1 Tax=Thalassotalea marina TaxID=1673741 RepID=A0A919EIL9_9GAMM|nr:5-oxoprolinase subunit PxpB [Thalassotalea marina]GHF83502.1 allophanate hydrolase [Thalassotalea marina]
MSINLGNAAVEVAGESALIVYLNEHSLIETSRKVAQLKMVLSKYLADKVTEFIPSYNSLLVVFDPYKTDYFEVRNTVNAHLTSLEAAGDTSSTVIELPVFYSPQSGPDLDRIANKANLTIDEVIDLHQAKTYQVFALGFAPGFAFLGEVDERIAMPRLATPRKKVPKGAVGIADQQTAIYPSESPGGWNLIGLCPIALFDATKAPHVPFSVGDSVKFTRISEQEFLALGGALDHEY